MKTNTTVGPGGATVHYGVIPDMITLAKSIGAGLAVGAIGMSQELAERYTQIYFLRFFLILKI